MMNLYKTLAVVMVTSICVPDATAQKNRQGANPVAPVGAIMAKPGAPGQPGQNTLLRGGGPSNDECGGAIALTVNSSCEPQTFNSDGATESQAAATCTGFMASAANDVWFSFVAVSAATQVEVTGTEDFDPVLEVFNGTCGSLEAITCTDGSTLGGTEVISITTTPGNTYYVRVYHWPYTNPPSNYDFSICVFGGDSPANDQCANVTAEALSMGGSLSFSGSTTLATTTNDAEPGSMAEGLGPVVWHAFTISECMDVTLDYCATDDWDAVYGLLITTCPAGDDILFSTSANFTDCANGSATISYLGLNPGTYYIPVGLFESANGAYSINLSSDGTCTQLPNDDCDSAVELTPAESCNYVNGSTLGASQSLPAITCNTFTGNANDDVWYKFTATETTHTIRVQGNGDFDAVVDLRSGTCASSNNIDCSDFTEDGGLEEIIASGLTVGTTYYVRVYDWYTAAPNDLTFGICVLNGAQPSSVAEVLAGELEWTLFPNPSEGQVNLMWGAAGTQANIEVFDVTGRVVFGMRTWLQQGEVFSFNVPGAAAGRYVVRVVTPEAVSQRMLQLN